MRVLLINPWDGEIFPTPAIGYLQAVLKNAGIEVTAMDLKQALTTKGEYELVAVTFHSFSVKYAKDIRRHFKGRLICGGHHPTALPYQMIKIGYDQVVLGEGENAIIEIVLGNTEQMVSVPNTTDIIPDYTGLSFSGDMGIPVISSRGCAFSCNFCASSNFWNHRVKMRSADSVLCEIEHWKNKGYKTWMFEDDNFTFSKKRVYEICQGLDGKYLWQCASRAESLDIELCREIYRAGCRTVWLGIESFSQDSLDRCNKHTTAAKMITGIKNAEYCGLKTICQFIIGLPGDTEKDILETKQIIKNNRINAGFNIAWILPGTKIHEEAKKRGFTDDIYLSDGAPFYTYEHSLNEMKAWIGY